MEKDEKTEDNSTQKAKNNIREIKNETKKKLSQKEANYRNLVDQKLDVIYNTDNIFISDTALIGSCDNYIISNGVNQNYTDRIDIHTENMQNEIDDPDSMDLEE